MSNIPEKTEIQNAIQSFCDSKVISREDLALQSGVSTATISHMMAGKWQSISDRQWLKIYNYVRPAVDSSQLFNTADYVAIKNQCKAAKSDHYMTALIAAEGMGKTTALKALARNENVFYVYIEFGMSARYFFLELGRVLGYQLTGNVSQMKAKVCDILNQLVSPLLLIDEAGKISQSVLMHIHALHDRTKGNIGIVLAGMPYFRTNLIKMSKGEKQGIGEFYDRIDTWQELTGLSAKEVEAIAKHHQITDSEQIARLRHIKRFRALMREIRIMKLLND